MSASNANKVFQLRNCATLLEYLAQSASDLANDQSPLPDKSGTVASVFQQQVAALEKSYLLLLAPVQSALNLSVAAAAAAIAPPVIATASNVAPGDVKANRVASAGLVLKPGDFFIAPDRETITVFIPNDTIPATLPIQAAAIGRGWQISGTDDAPTLKPSINAVGKWHGWLTAGVFTVSGAQSSGHVVKSSPAASVASKPAGIAASINPAPHNPPPRVKMAGSW